MRRAAHRPARLAALPASVAALLVLVSTALAGGLTETTVEGGAFFDFVAPDAGTATSGTIRFGLTGPLETIAADAELVPPADTNLVFLGSGTPTCLEVTREGGQITRLAFVAECTVSGEVILAEDVFGPDADAYLIGDRVATPASFVTGDAEFAALIGVAADAGTTLSIVFTVDVTVGFPVSFVATTTATGPVTLLPGGDIGVDGATLPSEVIDDAARAALAQASTLGVDASVTVTGTGNLQTKSEIPEMAITLAVSFEAPAESVAPSPSPTSAASPVASALPDTGLGGPSGPPAADGPPMLAVLALLALSAVAVARGIGTGVRSDQGG